MKGNCTDEGCAFYGSPRLTACVGDGCIQRRFHYEDSKNNPLVKSSGGSTSYYEVPENAEELQDLIEYKDMDFARANIFKAAYRLGEKDGAEEEYDLRKIIFFAVRKLNKLTGKKYDTEPHLKND